MRIIGEWLLCDDGVTRPTIRAYVRTPLGRAHADDFLIDSGSDRTVFSASLWRRLGAIGREPSDVALQGVGGEASSVLVEALLEFERGDGQPITIRGEFSAFTDAVSSELSIVGRDVLDNFDLILSRRRGEVLLLAPNHRYQVTRL
jgi:hypothetical protein